MHYNELCNAKDDKQKQEALESVTRAIEHSRKNDSMKAFEGWFEVIDFTTTSVKCRYTKYNYLVKVIELFINFLNHEIYKECISISCEVLNLAKEFPDISKMLKDNFYTSPFEEKEG